MPFWLTPTLWVLATPFDIRVRYKRSVYGESVFGGGEAAKA